MVYRGEIARHGPIYGYGLAVTRPSSVAPLPKSPCNKRVNSACTISTKVCGWQGVFGVLAMLALLIAAVYWPCAWLR